MSRDHLHTCSILGAFFASKPIEGSVIVYHSPAGCEKMVLHAASAHDSLGYDPGKVELCQVGTPEAVFGGEGKLRAHLDRLQAERPDLHVFVVSSCAPEIVGDDIEGIIRSSGSDGVTFLGGAGFRGDLWAGFSEALERLARDFCTSTPDKAPAKDSVNVIGYLCDRLEHDHLANIQVIVEMLDALGLGLNSFFVGPTSRDGLKRSWAAAHNIAFDYGAKASDVLARRYGQNTIRASYPIGLGGTSAFLREVGRATGRAERAEDYIDAQLRIAVPLVDAARGSCRLKRVGVSADSQKMPGLVEFLLDLGMLPAWLQILDETHENLPTLRAVLGEGFGQVLINPDDEKIRGMLAETDLIVGSHVDKHRYGERVPVYEFTYPCFDRHCLSPEPEVGFVGAVRLASNLANLISFKDTRKFGVAPDDLLRMGLEEPLRFRCR